MDAVTPHAHPDLPQVACFDTAFHHGHPELSDRFALPRAFYDEGVRRYGFHGLSYEYVSGALRKIAPGVASGRLVIAHLGSGASAARHTLRLLTEHATTERAVAQA